LLNHSFTGWTLLGAAMRRLEASRKNLLAAADAKVLSPQCQAPAKDAKGNSVKYNQATINQLTAEVSAAVSMVDAYELSLFGGKVPAPTKTGDKAKADTADAKPDPSTNSGTALQQLLYADLLLRRLGATPNVPVLDPKKPYFLVSVHAVDSDGNTLAKASLLSGSHLFFSGGAVSTFSVFKGDGSTVCSGISYGYRGFVTEDGMTAAINDQHPGPDPTPTPEPGDRLPATNHFTSTCTSGY